MKPPLLIALWLLSLSNAGAQSVYKSVDAQGNVTYSSTPPPGGGQVVEVPIAPPPPEAQRKAAEERLRQLQTESAESESRAPDRQQPQSAADAELQQARAELEQTRIQRDDDWQTLAAGGRVLKQSYLDRVAGAERRVKAAEEVLRKARGRGH